MDYFLLSLLWIVSLRGQLQYLDIVQRTQRVTASDIFTLALCVKGSERLKQHTIQPRISSKISIQNGFVEISVSQSMPLTVAHTICNQLQMIGSLNFLNQHALSHIFYIPLGKAI